MRKKIKGITSKHKTEKKYEKRKLQLLPKKREKGGKEKKAQKEKDK